MSRGLNNSDINHHTLHQTSLQTLKPGQDESTLFQSNKDILITSANKIRKASENNMKKPSKSNSNIYPIENKSYNEDRKEHSCKGQIKYDKCKSTSKNKYKKIQNEFSTEPNKQIATQIVNDIKDICSRLCYLMK